jgi:hypothetical protein
LKEIYLSQTVKKAGFGGDTEKSFPSSELLGDDDVNPDAIRRMLSIIAQNSIPILIIDEFDRISPDVRHALADTIKTLSDHAVAATVVIVGVAESIEQLIE